ncbi:hypothetical protein IWQ61_008368 [Dispira simplex]|nr:hypothetical protein IWQ61_008368 [Dispira simplex]
MRFPLWIALILTCLLASFITVHSSPLLCQPSAVMVNQGEIQHLQRRMFGAAAIRAAKNIGKKVASKLGGKDKSNKASNKSKEEAKKKKEAAAKKKKEEKAAAKKEKEAAAKKKKEEKAAAKKKKKEEAAAKKKEKEATGKKKKVGTIVGVGATVGLTGMMMMDSGGSEEETGSEGETGEVVEGQVDPATSNVSNGGAQSNVAPDGSVIPADPMTNTSLVQTQQTSPGAAVAGAPEPNAQPNGWAGSVNPVVTSNTPVVQYGVTYYIKIDHPHALYYPSHNAVTHSDIFMSSDKAQLKTTKP